MPTQIVSSKPKLPPVIIWLIAVSFVLFQFFLQLSSGVVIGAIMHEMRLSAFTAGLLSSSFYIVYTGLQIPVGILFDSMSARKLLSINVCICSLGCFAFALSHGLLGLFLGRCLIGAGSAFAFIGLSHVLRQQYPLKQFAFMIGLSETLGFIVTVIGMMMLGSLISHWGWRSFINLAGLVGLFIAYLSWQYIPDIQTKRQHTHGKQLLKILSNGKIWINGLFVGLSFTVVTVFGALWAIPFFQLKLECSIEIASWVCAMFFLGTAFSCPLFGLLSTQFKKRIPLILFSCVMTNILLLLVLYIPTKNLLTIGLLMFLVGTACGAYMLAYTIANELAPTHAQSTCTGFTNMLAVMTTPILQPLIGYELDFLNPTGAYSLSNYQTALLTVPVSIFIASILVCFLPEKRR